MKKNFINKKLYFILLLLILITVLIISCRKMNILNPTHIPPPTDFRIPEDAIPGHVDVKPMPAQNGEVFGGFSKKFKYQGKWYILADYMYNYDPKSKTLTRTANNVLLEIDNNANINVYAKNVDYSIFSRLKYNISVIENDKIIYEPDTYGSFSESRIPVGYENVIDSIVYDSIYYTSSDLINWQEHGSTNNVRYKMPTPNPNNPNESFQGGYGMVVAHFFQFKDYIYLMGLRETFYEQNPSGGRPVNAGSYTVSKNYYYRIHKSKDTSVGANWEKIDNTPWGARSSGILSIHSLSTAIDKDKIYVTKGARCYYEYDPSINKWPLKVESFEDDKRIWSSTDGVNWTLEPNSDAYENAESVDDYHNYFKGLDKYLPNRVKTPQEPNWIKLDNRRYYKSDNSPYETHIINNKTYYVPIPPYEEIRAVYNSGQEYFTITEAHIKSAGLNQFLTKDKEPNKNENWKVITPIDYTDKLMVWQSGGEKVMLNINNKAVQLVDYQQIEYMYNTIKDYSIVINDLRKAAKELRDGTRWSEESKDYVKDIFIGMQYDARADILDILMNNREYIMPDEAVTHYTVEFRY